MILVKQLLKSKGDNVWSIGPQSSVYEALEMMADKDVGALLVLEEDRVAGIFSERDYARKGVLKGKSSKETKISDVMTKDVLTIGPEQNINDCMALMTNSRIRHLPVIDAGKLVGLISIGDVVNAVIKEQQRTIGQLKDYISGSSYDM